MERRERDAAMRDRDRYDDRRPENQYRDRDREMDRRAPYPPRRDYRDRDREAEYYDRVPTPSRPQWNAASHMDRPHSPHNSRRSPPPHRPISPYQSSRPTLSPSYDRREDYPRRPSQAILDSEPPYRNEGIPTGPRGASTNYPRSNAVPPLGPRSSFGRPSSSSHPSYEARIVGPPPVSSPSHAFDETAPRFSRKRSDEDDVSMLATGLSVPEAAISNVTSGWNEPVIKATSHNPQESTPNTSISNAPLEIPVIPVKDRLGKLDKNDFKGSSHPDLEAEAFNVSTARLRSVHSMYARPEFVAFRKALFGLSECQVEVEGAKTRTDITEAALTAAKEEAEAWSLESARIEIKEKNSGVQGWFDTKESVM